MHHQRSITTLTGSRRFSISGPGNSRLHTHSRPAQSDSSKSEPHWHAINQNQALTDERTRSTINPKPSPDDSPADTIYQNAT